MFAEAAAIVRVATLFMSRGIQGFGPALEIKHFKLPHAREIGLVDSAGDAPVLATLVPSPILRTLKSRGH